VGTAFMTPFGDTCAAVNMIIVDQSVRGRGLGRRLTTAVIGLAGDRECRLTATTDYLFTKSWASMRRIKSSSIRVLLDGLVLPQMLNGSGLRPSRHSQRLYGAV
jgi:GNAT superfamily N-acetyltransferase